MGNKQTALITGATSGIVYELAKLFAQNGNNLVIVARTVKGLNQTSEELKQQFGVDIVSISKDLSVPESAFELYDEVNTMNLPIDILVNDAGQGQLVI